MKNIVKGAIRDQKGQALILTLILLIVGGLIITPLLGFMGTGLLAGQVYEKKTDELYAADAGVEDAIWKIQHQDKVEGAWPCNPGSPPLTYDISDVNDKGVGVEIYYIDGQTYKVISTATSDSGGSTAVEAYIEVMTFDLFAGALVSKSDIGFHKDCTVIGDVYYVGEITGKEYEHIDGEETQISLDSFPTQGEDEAFAQQFKDEASAVETHTGDMNINSDTSLGPIYITGNLNIDKEVTITLAGIVYVKGYIRAAKTLTITGAGSIVAEGDINLLKLANYTVIGDSIIMSLNGNITVKKSDPDHELSINALIYAPNGTISFDKDMTVLGGVIGGNINIDKEGSFTYLPKGSSLGFPFLVTYGTEIKTYDINPS